jgi:hypothetical protein
MFDVCTTGYKAHIDTIFKLILILINTNNFIQTSLEGVAFKNRSYDMLLCVLHLVTRIHVLITRLLKSEVSVHYPCPAAWNSFQYVLFHPISRAALCHVA